MQTDGRMNSPTPFWLRECFYGNFMSPLTIQRTYVLMSVSNIFAPFYANLDFLWQIFLGVPNIKFYRNPCSWSHTNTDGHEDNGHFSLLWICAWKCDALKNSPEFHVHKIVVPTHTHTTVLYRNINEYT